MMRKNSLQAPSGPVVAPAAQNIVPSTPEVDQAGILSQTLSSSPNIKFILPARLRSALYNDVVFVGPTAIQLRQFTQQGELSDVLAELELGTQIYSAKVISADSHVVNVEDAILAYGRDEIRFTIRDQPVDDSQPPQILVLSIATGDLVYAYAKQSYDDSVQFVYAKRPIVGTISSPGKYGQHLAIDKSSRSIAVASMGNSFSILALKDVDVIKEAIDKWDPLSLSPFQPLHEQRFIPVDGIILRMDFLVPPKAAPQQVIILLIIVNAGVTSLLAYRWDSWRSLSTMKPLPSSGQHLLPRDSFPYLLIPSSTEASFSLVTQTQLAFYQDVTAHRPKRINVPLYPPPAPQEKSRDKIWVQWARPLRHDAYKAANEEVWLFREDGLMRSLITGLDQNRTTTQFDVDGIGIPIDGAVCALTAPPTSGGDILIICGDMAAGRVYHVMARQQPKFLQEIPNMSPMHDTIIADERPIAHRRSKRYSVLATTGRSDMEGSLAELRYGHEAQVRLEFDYRSAETVTNVWSAERMNGQQLLLIASHHENTTVMCYDTSGSHEELMLMDESNLVGFDFTCQTLAASQIDSDHILQISQQGLAIGSFTLNDCSSDIPTGLRCQTVCAYIESSTNSFALVKRISPTNHELIICQVQSIHDCRQIAQIVVDCMPLFVTYASLGTRAICIFVSEERRIHPYIIESNGQTYPLPPMSCEVPTGNLSTLSLSGLGILGASNNRILLICGFKSGEAWYLELDIQGNGSDTKLCLSNTRVDRIGQTAVTVIISHNGKEAASPQAYLACEGVSRTVKVFPHASMFDYQIDDILLVDHHQPTYSPVTISSITAIPSAVARQAGHNGALLLFATETEILLTEFSAPKLVPRTIRAISGPRQMVWSSPLKRLITVSNTTFRDAERRQAGSNESTCSLRVVDTTSRGPEAEEIGQPEFKLNTGETVKCLLSWAPTDGERHFDVVVIGTNTADDGRLSYMSARKMGEAATNAKAKTFATFSGKQIQAMCAFGLSTLAVGVGREVKLLYLDVGTKSKGWTQLASFELPSPASSIAAKGSMIYVGTTMHSFILLHEEQGRLSLVSSDRWAGKARSIVPYGRASVMTHLLSGAGSRILGFADMPTRGSAPAFEARVPQVLDRLVLLKSSVPDHTRHRFIGTSVDGAVQLFTTLSKDEITLLKFLESLCEPRPTATSVRAKSLARRIARLHSSRLENAGRIPPSSETTHAHGDQLRLLLEPGPFNLHYMMMMKEVKVEGGGIKVEDDRAERLEKLARPVIGDSEYVVDRVVAWLRRLLNVPSLS